MSVIVLITGFAFGWLVCGILMKRAAKTIHKASKKLKPNTKGVVTWQ